MDEIEFAQATATYRKEVRAHLAGETSQQEYEAARDAYEAAREQLFKDQLY